MKTPYALALASLLLLACSTQPEEITPVTDVPEATSDEVTFDPFAFTLPEGAELVSQEDGVAMISVPDSEYEVTLKMTVDEASEYTPVEGVEREATAEGIEVFHEGCSGYCMTVTYDGLSYLFWIEVQSTELPPENLDGVWGPSAEVDLDAFMNTVHLAK